ncbi:hypothetical protein [Streptomyces sp. NBC_00019]|uniref:hypothetical protein n=1 Tax=Streptomyces sp. NBC_00019 TaxID=2975623 RepID=UPI00324AAE29
MLDVIDAAAGFPTVLFTSALVVSLAFWLRVLLGRAGVRDFDADAPALARMLGEAPVAVSASVVAASGWLVSFAGTVVLDRAGWTGIGSALAHALVFALSALVAWSVTRTLAAPLTRLFSREREPRQRELASGAPVDPGSSRAHR